LYPSGVGDTQGQFLGAFLRPVNSDTEIGMEQWARPINYFVFRIKRPLSVISGDVNGADYVTQYTEEDFDGFSNDRTGWGFHEFCTLPLPFDELCDENDSIGVEVQIAGLSVAKTSTIDYKATVMIPKNSQTPTLSSPFGPQGCMWQLQLSLYPTDSDSNFLAAYICPVHSEFEMSMGSEWDRVISTFSLKIRDLTGQGVLSAKSITGSFTFSNTSPMAGWDEFVELQKLGSLEDVEVVVHVTWDPALLSEYTSLGKTKLALTSVTNQYQECFENLNYLQSESYNLQNSNFELSQALEQLQTSLADYETLQQQHSLMNQELIALRNRVKMLTAELQESRVDEQSLQMKEIQLATVKERISKVRFEMDKTGVEMQLTSDSDTELFRIKTELASVLYQKAQLELQVAQMQSELNFINRSAKDNVLMSSIPNFESEIPIELDPSRKLLDAIEVCKNETTVGETALAEIQTKICENLSQVEKSGLIAEITMVQCGLDVASATMYEVTDYASKLPDSTELYESQRKLEEIRYSLLQTRVMLEGFSLDMKSSMLAESPSLAELGPPPVVARHGGNKKGRKVSTDSAIPEDKIEKLDSFTNKMESIVEILKSKIATAPVVSQSTLNDDFESWTPNEAKNSTLDPVQLQVSCRLT
jgi:hypothetical protein